MAVEKLTKESIKDFISNGKCVVKYGATYCAPCKAMDPVLESLSSALSFKVGKADIMECMEQSRSSQIMSVPTTIIYQDGKEVSRMVGFKDKESLEEFLKK